MSLIQSTTPLNAGATYTSPAFNLTRATKITGTAFANQNGTLYIDQGGDGVNFDFVQSVAVGANTGVGVEYDVINPYFRVRFTNTAGANQTVFRLYIDARDQYGLFLQAAGTPSIGGNYLAFYLAPGSSSPAFVGRFNALDGYDANGQASIYKNVSGKFISFTVAQATVTTETLQPTTLHTPDVF